MRLKAFLLATLWLPSHLTPMGIPQALVVGEGPGHLTAGDFDGDNIDDLLLIGVYGVSGVYSGQGTKPHRFQRIGDWKHTKYWSLRDAPVLVGGHLYVAECRNLPGTCEIGVYKWSRGVWRKLRAIAIRSSRRSGSVNSIRITPLHKDVDGDRLDDLLAVWGDVPLQRNGGFQAAYISPSGLIKQVKLPPIRGQTSASVIVDLHLAKPMVRTGRPEYLVTMSANLTNRLGGFGFLILEDGPKPGAGVWASGGPPLAYDNHVLGESPVAYGDFDILPTFETPLVHLSTGESILFFPWISAPYVSNSGQTLFTTRDSLFLNQAIADFDGDGRDEIVLLERYGAVGHSFMHIGDPSKGRKYSQFFALTPPGGRYQTIIRHGVSGDFDGDGDPDLVLSGRRSDQQPPHGVLHLFVADRSKGAGRPALVKMY